MNGGRCRDCFAELGLADHPAPDSVHANKQKVACKRCNAPITPLTSWRLLGFCQQCVKRLREPLPTDPDVAKSNFSRKIEPTKGPSSSSFFERYEGGERQAVWTEMQQLSGRIGQGAYWDDAQRTVTATMKRVRTNIETIVERLRSLGYRFDQPARAHVPPSDRTLRDLDQLEEAYGSLPLSLRGFYETVGSVNLCQSEEQLEPGCYNKREQALRPPLDVLGEEYPLYVAPPETLLQANARRISRNSEGRRYLWIAPDECGRAHYSNGDDCHVLLPEPGADFRWLEFRDDTIPMEQWLWFIDVLREAFRGGGFQGKTLRHKRSPPKNEIVDRLCEGLLPV